MENNLPRLVLFVLLTLLLAAGGFVAYNKYFNQNRQEQTPEDTQQESQATTPPGQGNQIRIVYPSPKSAQPATKYETITTPVIPPEAGGSDKETNPDLLKP